jgi:hypothetical protein
MKALAIDAYDVPITLHESRVHQVSKLGGAKTADALAQSLSGHARGKIVLKGHRAYSSVSHV